MANVKIKLDHAGMAEILRDFPVALLDSEASKIASGAEGETASGKPVPVRRSNRTAKGGRLSERPAVDVTLAHPAGQRIEAKRGTLARAAAAAGFEVNSMGGGA
jgi:hypothetical protein